MSECLATARGQRLLSGARFLHNWYEKHKPGHSVLLFAEDFDWLDKKGAIKWFMGSQASFEGVPVARGPRKRKARKKRPPDMHEQGKIE